MRGRTSPAAVRTEKLSSLGPAVAAQVHDRLAHAVAGQLGLGAVGVEDAHLGDEAALVGLAQQQDAVRAHARVGRAEGADALGRELERELAFLDDGVVVAERLPLLEAHGAGTVIQRRSVATGGPLNSMTCWIPVGRFV